MPDLLEPKDPGGRYPALIHQVEPTPAAGELPGPSLPAPAGLPILQFEQVSKWFGPVIGVNQVTLELRAGITGLVGHNGAGKSTLMKLAAGQVKPDLGSVKIAGHEAGSPQAKLHVGYCPDLDIFYEEMSGRQFVRTLAKLCGFPHRDALRRTEETLDLVGMQDRADLPLRGYSKGMRQRIKLAQALIHDPELLLLDEPLSGIDPLGRRESVKLFLELARRGKCLLISSHELEELEKLTNHVAIMSAGRIAAVGELTRLRDLLDQHPLSFRILGDQARELARALLNLEEVVGLDRDGESSLLVRVRNSRNFLEKLTGLVVEEHFELRHLEPLDETTRDILGYLLERKRNHG